MDKWPQMEPPLEVQLPTPVTLATHCLVHSHELVELMETGHLSLYVKVSAALPCLNFYQLSSKN